MPSRYVYDDLGRALHSFEIVEMLVHAIPSHHAAEGP